MILIFVCTFEWRKNGLADILSQSRSSIEFIFFTNIDHSYRNPNAMMHEFNLLFLFFQYRQLLRFSTKICKLFFESRKNYFQLKLTIVYNSIMITIEYEEIVYEIPFTKHFKHLFCQFE